MTNVKNFTQPRGKRLLTIVSAVATAAALTFAGAGTASAADAVSGGPLTITAPSSVNFGNDVLGYPVTGGQVTITNTTNAPVTYTKTYDIEPRAKVNRVSADSGCGRFFEPTTLAAGASCTFHFSYTGEKLGLDSGGTFALTTTTTDNAVSSVVIPFTANVLAPVTLTSPKTLVFPNTAVGGRSTQTVTVSNTSGEPDDDVAVQVSFNNLPAGFSVESVDPCGDTPSAGCTFTVTFAPTAATTYSGKANLILGFYSFGERSDTLITPITLTGTGVSPTTKPLVSTPVPRITGSTIVGSTLTAQTGVWQPQPVALSYQWLREGAPIVGATNATYTLTTADTGKRLSVTVTGTKAGYATASQTSSQAAPVRLATLKITNPTISGTGKVGATLTAVTGTWGPAPIAFSYQWTKNGAPIAGATGSKYVVRTADLGARIAVTVTGSKTGYQTVVIGTGPVTIR